MIADNFETGMLAISKAGRDRGEWYMIVRVEADYVYLANGTGKPLEAPKKKKKKHVQRVGCGADITACDDLKIKRIIKEALKRTQLEED